jgi:hypothetical protein
MATDPMGGYDLAFQENWNVGHKGVQRTRCFEDFFKKRAGDDTKCSELSGEI